MEVDDVLDVLDIDEIRDPLLYCTCSGCRNLEHEGASYVTDKLGYHWCKDHAYRANIIDYGYTHNWPIIDVHSFVISDSPTAYVNVLMYCSEDNGYLAEAAMQYEQSQEEHSNV